MIWETEQLHINIKAPPHLSSNGPCKNDSLAYHKGVGHVGMEALVSYLQIVLIHGAIALVE